MDRNSSDSWSDGQNLDNGGAQGNDFMRGQNVGQGQQGNYGDSSQFDSNRMTGQDTGRRPQGGFGDDFASQGGTDSGPAIQGGDFNADPTSNAPRVAAGRDDNFGSQEPNVRGSVGGPTAIPGDDDAGSAGTMSGGNPGMGDKFVGNVQKAAGRVSGNANMVERGQMRKTGGPQADDTLL
ncbi:hypothetical protein BV20DRAFT_1048243 [Pilatotrama ljubarskyi]|nr:hypothetical protein BV20DRAFT_1048243 [Pilatotrama ljubarskyi]